MSEVLLRAQSVRKTVRDGGRSAEILRGVDLEISSGDCVALIGASGSGKSTLLHILGALDPDFQGSVRIDGACLESMSDTELATLRNRRLGFVFQSYNLLGHLRALENVHLPGRFAAERADIDRARALLERVGLSDKMHQKPNSLSGGEQQRVAIARALYHEPAIVFCDEPTGNLDRQTAAEVLKLFNGLTEQGVALLIATHDADIAKSAMRVHTLEDGLLQ